MPRTKSKPLVVDVPLLDIDKPTSSGHIFPRSIIEQIAGKIAMGDKVTIEEVSPVERQVKNIKPFESWTAHAMAESVDCRVEDGTFHIVFAVKNNKYGKLLKATIESSGDRIRYFPVGIGDTDESGIITSYQLVYVSFEIKAGADAK